jgi:hypothetical protein
MLSMLERIVRHSIVGNTDVRFVRITAVECLCADNSDYSFCALTSVPCDIISLPYEDEL